MAYVTTNPPALISQKIGGSNGAWFYKSADTDDTVNGSDYFTNGRALGMQVGDLVIIFDSATPKTSLSFVSVLDTDGNATTAFAAVA